LAIIAIQEIQDLAVVMLLALAVAFVFHRLGQPLILGYILAGILAGPFTPPFSLILHIDILGLLAEIGIVFLLFAIGLEFPIARFRSVGRKAMVIALCEALTTFAVGALVARAFGLSNFDSLFIGLATSVTSTVVLSKVLEELGVLTRPEAGLVLGITVVEDVVVITCLGLLQSIAPGGSLSILGVLLAVTLVVVFIGAVLLLGPRIVGGSSRGWGGPEGWSCSSSPSWGSRSASRSSRASSESPWRPVRSLPGCSWPSLGNNREPAS
jgi:monovalent cation:H+ antiporter-2, CPA2 family